MSSKLLFALLLSACAAGPNEQVALAPTAAPAVPEEPPLPGEPPSEPPAPAEPPPVSPVPVAPAPISPSPSPSGPLGPRPVEQLPGAVWPPPGGWTPPPCEVEASTSLAKRGAVYEVTARLKNRTKTPIEFDVPDRCPLGPAYFHGLGESYDYYGTCVAGVCAAPRPPVHFRIAPGQTITVTSIQIEPNGNGCNAPLEPGAYAISFGLSTGHVLCGGPAAQFERSAPPQKLRAPTPPKKCPPQPACGIACPGGNFARDENGCSTCGCAKGPSVIAPSEPGGSPPSQ